MSYKAFEDFYKEATIKHLLLFEHQEKLISPPFCTDLCKDYSRVMIIDNNISFIDIDTPPATSKYNSMVSIGNSMWYAPYGIWDQFNTFLEIKNSKPVYHTLASTSRGQFYNLASSGVTAFAAPLGYDQLSFALFIDNQQVQQIPMPANNCLKKHMGTTYANRCYYSPPRGESLDYNSILKFDPVTEILSTIKVDSLPLSGRKYSDFIAVGTRLYALPFGNTNPLQYALELDTTNDAIKLIKLDVPAFTKKYNGGVVIDDVIIALPYGHKDDNNSNVGLIFNTATYEHTTFNIAQTFGGKYRFRSGINFNGVAVFLPTGTPGVPIVAVDKQGRCVFVKLYPEFIMGRPIIFRGKINSIAYKIETKQHFLFTLDQQYQTNFKLLTGI